MAKYKKSLTEIQKKFQECNLDENIQCMPLPGSNDPEYPDSWMVFNPTNIQIYFQGPGSRLFDFLTGVLAVTSGNLPVAEKSDENEPVSTGTDG